MKKVFILLCIGLIFSNNLIMTSARRVPIPPGLIPKDMDDDELFNNDRKKWHSLQEKKLENRPTTLTPRVSIFEPQVSRNYSSIHVSTETCVSDPTKNQELLSLSRYVNVLQAMLQPSEPAIYHKIHIVCTLLGQYASLRIKTTDTNEISTHVEFSSKFIPDNNPALQPIQPSVFFHLQKTPRVSFKNSDMNAYSIPNLSQAILDMSKLPLQDTYNFARIALGEHSGEIIFEQPKQLTIQMIS